MDKRKYKYNRIKITPVSELPTIVVNSASDDIPYADEETEFVKNSTTGMANQKESDDELEKRMENRREAMGRRNSISLPNLDDMKVFTSSVEMGDFGKSGETLNNNNSNEEDDEDEEFRRISGYPRSVRRKSVLSPRMLKPPGDDLESDPNSPANSVTSINSIASLLKERIQNLPQTIRKKKTPEYKTKIFVGLLFIAIVVLIVTSYFLYNQKVLARAYFERIKFNKVKRVMKIYSNEGVDIVHATLGTNLNYDNVLPCLPSDNLNDGTLCLEWMHRARLYLGFHERGTDLKCYNLRWISLSENVPLTDCFDMSNSHWYGGGQTAESAWPLEKGSHFFQPFITGQVEKHEWGNVLKRYFINSKGGWKLSIINETISTITFINLGN